MSTLTFHHVGPNQTQAGGVSRGRLYLLSHLASPVVSTLKDGNSTSVQIPSAWQRMSRRQVNEQLGRVDQASASVCADPQ